MPPRAEVGAMPYSLTFLWRQRRTFVPAVLAVGFSAMLVASQSGLVLGILSYTSMPIDRSGADLWVMNRDVETFLHSHPMREAWLLRLAGNPGVKRVEVYLYGLASWHKPGQGSSDTCCVIGSRLEEGALGAVTDLTPAMRWALAEPGAVVVDRSDLGRLGL